MGTLKMGTMKKVPINKLMVDENYRESAGTKKLAKSMREYGILTPLSVVEPDSKGRYEILSGEDRYFAAKWLNDQDDDFKVKDMPCYIVAEHMDDEEKLMIRAQLAMEMPDEGNRERSRFRLVEMLCGKADRKEINEDSITGILTNSYGFD